MNFIEGLVEKGYVYDNGCYVRVDAKGFTHRYREREESGKWSYVKMTPNHVVISSFGFTTPKEMM